MIKFTKSELRGIAKIFGADPRWWWSRKRINKETAKVVSASMPKPWFYPPSGKKVEQ